MIYHEIDKTEMEFMNILAYFLGDKTEKRQSIDVLVKLIDRLKKEEFLDLYREEFQKKEAIKSEFVSDLEKKHPHHNKIIEEIAKLESKLELIN